MVAFKLVRVREDGSLGSLFVRRSRRLPVGKWIKADLKVRPRDRVAGGGVLKLRPGWHAAEKPALAHLTRTGRAVFKVRLRKNVKRHIGPQGVWYTADEMYIMWRMR